MSSGKKLGVINGYEIHVYSHMEELKDEWYKLQSEKYCTIYQHYDWVRIAKETINKNDEFLIIVVREVETNEVALIIPLVVQDGAVKKITWTGSTHSPLNSPVYSKKFATSGDHSIFHELFLLAGKSISGLAMTTLGNQPLHVNNIDNPIRSLKHTKSVNSMFVMDLSEGFDAVLEAGNAKRKRKAFRKQQRTAESMGGYEVVVPESREEIISAIDEFRAFKKTRFKQMGIPDVFADQDTIDFLNALGCEPAADNHQLFKIIQLKVGGITRALYAGGIIDDYFQASINAIAIDDFTPNSPGEFLLYLMVEDFVSQGFQKADLGVGSERYKHSWCQHEYELFDVIMPLSGAAKPVVKLLQWKNAAKGFLRGNQFIWSNIKRWRKFSGQFKK